MSEYYFNKEHWNDSNTNRYQIDSLYNTCSKSGHAVSEKFIIRIFVLLPHTLWLFLYFSLTSKLIITAIIFYTRLWKISCNFYNSLSLCLKVKIVHLTIFISARGKNERSNNSSFSNPIVILSVFCVCVCLCVRVCVLVYTLNCASTCVD